METPFEIDDWRFLIDGRKEQEVAGGKLKEGTSAEA
jgi:hypothetical protein